MYQAHGKVDGRVVVLLLFAGALLLWGVALLTGIHKRQGRGELPADGSPAARDSSAHPDTLRAWLAPLDREWVKITKVEGQGYVILVPCYTASGSLAFRLPADSLPQVECESCDSLGRYAVMGIARDRVDSSWEIHLNPPAGSMGILPVTDALLQRFPEAPFQDRLLIWTRPLPAASDSVGLPAVDTALFVPRRQENEFEVLRAEDENPEGCGEVSDLQ